MLLFPMNSGRRQIMRSGWKEKRDLNCNYFRREKSLPAKKKKFQKIVKNSIRKLNAESLRKPQFILVQLEAAVFSIFLVCFAAIGVKIR